MQNPKGIAIFQSQYSVKETIDRLQSFLQEHGATIYARIDQQVEAEKVGLRLRPLEFILFGNPKTGGPIMAENPLVALDLPLKVIAWEDNEKKVWIGYNEASYIGDRYLLPGSVESLLDVSPLIKKVLTN
ncbi:MAG: DUF302 domain-containing protein [Ginsengibacter sp.]